MIAEDEGVLDYHEGSAMMIAVRQNETIFPVRLHPLCHRLTGSADIMILT